VADLPATEPRLSAAGASGRFAVSWAAAKISSAGEDQGTRVGAAVRDRDSGWRARTLEARDTGAQVHGPGLTATLSWAVPTPSEGQLVGTLWTAERPLGR